MSEAFDPYYTWLGIAPDEQPPNHYRLLAIRLFERNSEVIKNAADRLMAHLRTYQIGKHVAESQKLLNEAAAAKVCLLDPEKRASYDAVLRIQAARAAIPVPPPAPPIAPPTDLATAPAGEIDNRADLAFIEEIVERSRIARRRRAVDPELQEYFKGIAGTPPQNPAGSDVPAADERPGQEGAGEDLSFLEDIVKGTPVASRNRPDPELENFLDAISGAPDPPSQDHRRPLAPALAADLPENVQPIAPPGDFPVPPPLPPPPPRIAEPGPCDAPPRDPFLDAIATAPDYEEPSAQAGPPHIAGLLGISDRSDAPPVPADVVAPPVIVATHVQRSTLPAVPLPPPPSAWLLERQAQRARTAARPPLTWRSAIPRLIETLPELEIEELLGFLLVALLVMIGYQCMRGPLGGPTIDDGLSIEEPAALVCKMPPENLEKFEVEDTPVDSAASADTLWMNEPPTVVLLDSASVTARSDEMGNGHTWRGSVAKPGDFRRATLSDLYDHRRTWDLAVPEGESVSGGFGGRRASVRKAMVGGFGGTKSSERAVAAALNWIARHQNPDGSWSLEAFNRHCKDATCSGVGSMKSDTAATALGLLPFLAAGQTHEVQWRPTSRGPVARDGPYQATIHKGLVWLQKRQKSSGDLRGDGSPTAAVYAHAMATIALSEAYGLTGDKEIGQAAQMAINFIQSIQHPRTGGWRYNPGEEGDTSVVGWQAMALKSAQMAYLNVNQAALQGVKHWLLLCAAGKNRGLFSYQPASGPSESMTAVGMLLQQYAGMKPDDPAMREGAAYVMSKMPDPRRRALYYWYYATQVMHNMPGPDWDKWNRRIRHALIENQIKEGCAAGSWDPNRPTREELGESGGRLCVTSLSALTLEVYYRYLPLYKLDAESAIPESVTPLIAEDDMRLDVARPRALKPEAAPEKPWTKSQKKSKKKQ